MKRCPDCGESKPLDNFPRNRNSKDGRHAYCKPCHNARGQETRQRLYGGSRHYHLKRRYGIGADEFDEMVAAQGGVCAVCGRPDPEHVDHDHVTGRVRGILCFNCNGGLGQFADDIDRLESAAHYLAIAGVVADHARDLHDLAIVRAGRLVAASG
jgi:hypothetical protein